MSLNKQKLYDLLIERFAKVEWMRESPTQDPVYADSSRGQKLRAAHLERYLNDPVFNLRVKRLVSGIMATIDECEAP